MYGHMRLSRTPMLGFVEFTLLPGCIPCTVLPESAPGHTCGALKTMPVKHQAMPKTKGVQFHPSSQAICSRIISCQDFFYLFLHWRRQKDLCKRLKSSDLATWNAL